MRKKERKNQSENNKNRYPKTTQSVIKSFGEEENRVLKLLSYDITDEPTTKYPPKIQHHVEEIHGLLYKDPVVAISKLEDLITKHPKIPVFYNYLVAAYGFTGEKEKSLLWSKKNYEKNPDYIFARLDLASIYLESGELEKFDEILEKKFDLKLLYPQRKVFHITEAAGFFCLMAEYYLLKGMKPQSKMYYDMLRQLVPNHPETKFLKKKLYPIRSGFPFSLLSMCLKLIVLLILIPLSLVWVIIKKLWQIIDPNYKQVNR